MHFNGTKTGVCVSEGAIQVQAGVIFHLTYMINCKRVQWAMAILYNINIHIVTLSILCNSPP